MVSMVCVLCELGHVRKKRRRLADEKPHVGEECESTHGDAFRVRRSNDRNNRKTRVQERARLRHDQVRLESSPPNGGEFRSGNVTDTPVTGSITFVNGGALPALSDQV
jgi:hypothetical protein